MSYDIENHSLTTNINLFKQINIDPMFEKIQMILVMKTTVSNNRIPQLNEDSQSIKDDQKVASICNSFFMNSASNLPYNKSMFQNRDISEKWNMQLRTLKNSSIVAITNNRNQNDQFSLTL